MRQRIHETLLEGCYLRVDPKLIQQSEVGMSYKDGRRHEQGQGQIECLK